MKDLDRLIGKLEKLARVLPGAVQIGAPVDLLTQAANTLRSMGEEIENSNYLLHELGVSLEEERAEASKLREQLEEARAWAENFAVAAADNGASRDKYKAALVEVKNESSSNRDLGAGLMKIDQIVSNALTPQEACEECGGSGEVEYDYDDPEVGATVKAKGPCPSCSKSLVSAPSAGRSAGPTDTTSITRNS